MSDFTRIISPSEITLPEFSTGYVDRGRSGGMQFRETMNVGRSWEERYAPQNDLKSFLSFFAYVSNLYRSQTIFEITHYDMVSLLGSATAGSNPVINGAAQTGSSIVTDGWQASSPGAGLLLPGDVMNISGRGLVYDVLSFSTDGAGNATIGINPPLWEKAGWNSDNKIITINKTTGAVKFSCVILSLTVPSRGYDGIYEGLQIRFLEVPS